MNSLGVAWETLVVASERKVKVSPFASGHARNPTNYVVYDRCFYSEAYCFSTDFEYFRF